MPLDLYLVIYAFECIIIYIIDIEDIIAIIIAPFEVKSFAYSRYIGMLQWM